MPDADAVIRFINGPECNIQAALTPQSSLIKSGLLDSLALFNLALWVEAEIGAPIDLATIELAECWDTAAAIAVFIAAERRRAKS